MGLGVVEGMGRLLGREERENYIGVEYCAVSLATPPWPSFLVAEWEKNRLGDHCRKGRFVGKEEWESFNRVEYCAVSSV